MVQCDLRFISKPGFKKIVHPLFEWKGLKCADNLVITVIAAEAQKKR